MPEVDWTLFIRMAALAGKAGWVGLAIYRLVVMRKTRTVTVNRQQLADELAIDRKSVYSGLKALEHAGVLRAKGGRGSFATVELLIEPW
jgi:predicted transcriptional regulator